MPADPAREPAPDPFPPADAVPGPTVLLRDSVQRPSSLLDMAAAA
jgi:hypothetical protein